MNKNFMQNVARSFILFVIFSTTALASELPAELAWSKRLVLSTTVTGVVDKVFVSPGQRLKAGELLLNLDVREFSAVRDQAAAKLLAARISYDEARRETTRAQELFDRTMISEHDLQIEKNNEAQAKAKYLQAKAVLQQAKVALERSRITAPYNCVVLNVSAQPGQTIVSGLKAEALAVVAEAGVMTARAWLPLSELSAYSKLSAQGVMLGKQQYKVISQHIVQEANAKGMYALEVTFKISGTDLYPGQTAAIIFP